MLDWQVKAPSRSCSITGTAFTVGDRVRSLLVRNPEGALERVDIPLSDAERYCVLGSVMGWWDREVEDPDNPDRARKMAQLESAEALLKSLCEDRSEDTESLEAARDRALLAQFLALHLERKRVLKPLDASGRRFAIRGTDPLEEVTLPEVELSPEDLPRLADALQPVLGS